MSQTDKLYWLWTHCRALGMIKQSDSKLLEEDIALFIADLVSERNIAVADAQRIIEVELPKLEAHCMALVEGPLAKATANANVGYAYKLAYEKLRTLLSAVPYKTELEECELLIDSAQQGKPLSNKSQRLSLYHGTDTQFDKFEIPSPGQIRGASNGAMGIWLAVDRELATKFGSICLEVIVQPKAVFTLKIDELKDMHNLANSKASEEDTDEDGLAAACQVYANFRYKLLDKGYDTVAIKELDGSIQMYVALDPESLTIVRTS